MKYMCDRCGTTFNGSTACIEHELVCSGKVKRVDVMHHVLNFSFDRCGVLHTDVVITEDYGYYQKDGKYYYDVDGKRELDCVGKTTLCIDDCDNPYFCYTKVAEHDPLSDEVIEDKLHRRFLAYMKDVSSGIAAYMHSRVELPDEVEDILYEHTEELVGYIGQWLGEDTMSVTQCRCFVSRLAENLNKYIG